MYTYIIGIWMSVIESFSVWILNGQDRRWRCEWQSAHSESERNYCQITKWSTKRKHCRTFQGRTFFYQTESVKKHYKLQATDKDSKENGEISYAINPPSSELFGLSY